jgi:hypothetical protein
VAIRVQRIVPLDERGKISKANVAWQVTQCLSHLQGDPVSLIVFVTSEQRRNLDQARDALGPTLAERATIVGVNSLILPAQMVEIQAIFPD